MRQANSLGNRLVALLLSIIMVLGMLPTGVFAIETTAEAQIGDITYDTLAEALAVVPTGTDQVAPSEPTTVKLLRDTAYAFDVGTSTGATTMNLKLDLNGNTLTLSPSVGSVGTKTAGIRVLAYSKLEITNGTMICSSKTEDSVKVGIANYGELVLDSVSLQANDLITQYTVNNRGALTLKGNTAITKGTICAITNDPYNLYYTTNVNASVTCDSSDVVVESILVERYERNSANKGGVELNISAGYFGKIVEDGNTGISASYNVTGGTIGVSNGEELALALKMVTAGAPYTCPANPVTIKLLGSMAGSFDVGTSDGKAPKNILLDLNGNTLTLSPSVGSAGTKTNGIRVLAYSKLEIQNGTIICSSEAADTVKVGIANYSDLTLDGVAVNSGDLTIYTINNRGKLTLKGATSVENGKAQQPDYTDSTDYIAITNDPYNLYYSEPINAQINCDDADVAVGNIQLETYGSKGDIELNITDGSFGGVYAPAASGTATVKGAISGGSFETDVSDYCSEKYTAVLEDGKYVAKYVKDDQIDFGFAEDQIMITYNDHADNKYTFTVLNSKGTVTYSIEAGSEFAEIDAVTGELSVIKPGVVTVKAVDTGNELYNPAEASYTLTINKDEQQIAFAVPVPEDQWIGEPFDNAAAGGKGTGQITYSLYWADNAEYVTEIPDVAKIDPQTGKVTFLCTGKQITVQAVKAADDYYNSAIASYSVTATKKERTEAAFATTGPITMIYDPAMLSFNNAVVGCDADAVITWSVVSGNQVADLDTTTGNLTINEAGTIVVKATVVESAYYYEKAIEYTLVIKPADQAELNTDNIPAQITYSPDVQEGLIVGAGGSGTGDYGYEIIEGNEFAKIDAQTGAIKVLKTGNFVGDTFVAGVIKVQITKAGDTCYNAAEPVSVSISLVRADQNEFGFGVNTEATVVYNENNNQYTLQVTGGQSSKAVEFDVTRTENGDCATVDENGIVSIACAGVAYIRATKPADERYNVISDDFVLTIEKAEQDYALTEDSPAPLVYGTLTYSNPLAAGTSVSAVNKPVYSISINNIGANINAETGEVTFADSEGKVGKVTVTVTVAEDACYKKFSKSYELEVSYLEAPEEACKLEGTKAVPNSDNPWFVKDLTIVAPEGYEISYTNNLIGTTDWDSAQPYAEQGETVKEVFLRRISDGAITDGIDVAVKYDETAPDNLAIDYKSDFMTVVLQKIFLMTKEDMTVEFSAEDPDSGIAKVEYSVNGGADYTRLEAENGIYSIKLSSDTKNTLALRVTNGAGTVTEKLVDEVLVIDKTSPVIEAAFAGEYVVKDGIMYTKDDAFAINFRVIDENFSDIMNQENGETKKSLPVVKINGQVEELSWTDVNGVGQAKLPLIDEGDYLIEVTANDRLWDAESYQVTVHVDKTAPVIKTAQFTQGDVKNAVNGRKYYDAYQLATVVIEEHNFCADNVKLTVTVEGNEVSAEQYIAENWSSNGDANTLVLSFNQDANYTLDVAYTDIPGWEAADYAADLFTVDTNNPENLTIAYESDLSDMWPDFLENIGFAQRMITITIDAEDSTAGIMSLSYSTGGEFVTIPAEQLSSDDGSFSFDVSAEYEGQITLRATDYAGRVTEYRDGKTVIVDKVCPVMFISYDKTNLVDQIMQDNGTIPSDRQHMETTGEQTRFVYDDQFTATLRVEEAHFYGSRVNIQVTLDGVDYTAYQASDWTDVTVEGVAYREKTLTMTEDGDYIITVEYADESANNMDWSTGEHTATGTEKYVSNIHSIDTIAPKVSVSYTDEDQEVANTVYHSENREMVVTIEDRNFRPNEVALTITAEDVNGEPITTFAYDTQNDWADWYSVGNTWTTSVPVLFAENANYTVELTYADIAKNPAVYTDEAQDAQLFADAFTVDHDEPTDLSITYSDHLMEEVLSGISFGYYRANATVTLKATDLVAGIEYFTITAKSEGPTSATTIQLPNKLVVDRNGKFVSGQDTAGFLKEGDITVTSQNGTVTMQFEVPAAFRGTFDFAATDYAHLSTATAHPQVQIVDKQPAKRTITFNPTAIVDNITMKNVATVEEGDNVTLYYNKDAVASIQIEEANFHPEDVCVMVNGSAVELDGAWAQGSTDDIWNNTLTLTGDGDYVITMDYTDRSDNQMQPYTSQRIVIDTTAPVISVDYSNKDIKNTIDGIDYFNAKQTATITIKEHNFRASDVVVKVTAVDVLGEPVMTYVDDVVKVYAEQGADAKKWTAYAEGTWRVEDDTYVLTLNYSSDANYTFDIEYQDMAQNAAADYAGDKFTVDQTAPTNLKVSYSTHILEQIKESVTFGYYNAKMTVTITAEDDTSGIYHYAYSYIKGANVSGVNAELLDQAIQEAQITYAGKKATATFEIPKQVLGNDNQFNGTVEFTAYDRSEWSTELKDTRVVVVDNIAPTATITYNAPVQEVKGTSYYDGNIQATIVITEANFDSADVVVSVTRNGGNYPVNVSWYNNSVDKHTGTFTLGEDGDYTVSVQYKDKSGNQMNSYTSNKLTLDATAPTIRVSNIKANSANKDEKYGFVITIDDINLDVASMEPVLKTVLRNEAGTYETVNIDLGEAVAVVEGQTYTYTVEDLPEDGLYTLTCTVKDLAANMTTCMMLDDEKAYEQVQFSINRNGSVFAYGNTYTEELVSQYFIYSVDEDVVILEVNVDPIENYKLTLNDQELVEGTHYTTEQTSNAGEWSKRTYTVHKSCFETEGEYKLIVNSTDKAETTVFSDIKNLAISFVVDQTIPALTITGLQEGGRYQTDEQTVTVIPSDEGGRLRSLLVLLLDSNGEPMKDDAGKDISVLFNMSDEELLTHLAENGGMITFKIPEGFNNQIRIVCNDCAVNAEGTTNEYNELFRRVTVSSNKFVIFFADTPRFVAVVAGTMLAIGLVIFLLKRKSIKKSKAKA